MPELRRDPVTQGWVVIATERGKRPHDFAKQPRSKETNGNKCPFCEGNEALTPPEVMAYRPAGTPPNTPGWTVRVVPNLYPAFGPPTGDLNERRQGMYVMMNGLGAHEVLITSPRHGDDVPTLPTPQVALMAQSYIDRYLAQKANPIVQYVHIIMNYGKEAGASREHPHSQLFALPLVPDLVEKELRGAGAYKAEHGHCIFCDMVRQELASGERIVLENERFVVFTPYASKVPFEMWVVPKAHQPRFEGMDQKDVQFFADALKRALGKLHVGINDPPFNYWIHTSPTQRDVGDIYHWHLEIAPKLAIAAGFELGSGIMINTALPEAAAEFLRLTQAPEG
ncbi:MAG: galactose-1-phosphate uridylyltransferase [Dehalococcoidales bacterium]|nr:galactose-1-phosphate uridylyltransferase [Dehalococcoidales bacterium]